MDAAVASGRLILDRLRFAAYWMAREPVVIASTLAELVGGRDFPFHPIDGARIVLFGDAHGSAIEVYPDTVELVAGKTMVEARAGRARERHATHAAIATPLSLDEVLSVCADIGWPARLCDRGPFELVEVWVEDRFLLELLTPDMQADYRSSMTFENWARW
jgi:hypothetical protein